MDRGSHGGSAGARPVYHRTVGFGFWRGRPQSIDFRADWSPPALEPVQQSPITCGLDLANCSWKVVRQFVLERFGISLSRSSCLNWLHRLGFSFKQPKKRLLKASEGKREAFVSEYAALREECQKTGAQIFFADEAHFRADAELRGKWVQKGEPAPVE